MKKFLKESARIIVTGVAIVVFGVLVASAAGLPAFQEPTCAYPGCNVFSPINVGDQPQLKNGPLSVGGVLMGLNSSYFGTLGGTVGIGTTSTAYGFKVNVAGKVQASDFCLSGNGKCLSTNGGGGFDVSQLQVLHVNLAPNPNPHKHLGTPAKSISRMEWQECFFQNGKGITTPFPMTSGSGTCHAKLIEDPEAGPNPGIWNVFAECASGGKVISGGGAYYPIQDNDGTGRLRGSTPTTGGGYAMSGALGQDYYSGLGSQGDDGWMITGWNSKSYDGFYVAALCGY